MEDYQTATRNQQYAVRVRRKETAVSGPLTKLVDDGRGRPMLFNHPEDAEHYKKQLEEPLMTPDVTYEVEPFVEAQPAPLTS